MNLFVHFTSAFFLTVSGLCTVSMFQYISNKMQFYTVSLYLETALHVLGGTSTHHQEHTQLYLQHLVLVKLFLLPAAIMEEMELSISSMIAAGSNNGLTSTRCCRYSCVCSWWWVEVPPKHVEQFPDINKLCKVASCWIYVGIYLSLFFKIFCEPEDALA